MRILLAGVAIVCSSFGIGFQIGSSSSAADYRDRLAHCQAQTKDAMRAASSWEQASNRFEAVNAKNERNVQDYLTGWRSLIASVEGRK